MKERRDIATLSNRGGCFWTTTGDSTRLRCFPPTKEQSLLVFDRAESFPNVPNASWYAVANELLPCVMAFPRLALLRRNLVSEIERVIWYVRNTLKESCKAEVAWLHRDHLAWQTLVF